MTEPTPPLTPDDMETRLTDAQRAVSRARKRRGQTSADAWLHYLSTAITALELAEIEARRPCPKTALWNASKTTANATTALAETYPEVRRLRVVEIALEAVKWALWDLTEEGKVSVQRLPPQNYEDLP